MSVTLTYDGQMLKWPDGKTFKATTGYKDEVYGDEHFSVTVEYQKPDKQCIENGAIPEGNYKIYVLFQGEANIKQNCELKPSWGWTTIPEEKPGGCLWSEWGHNRARLEPVDDKTKKACDGSRGGFYIHDSTKGYSHGCIEVEPKFFRVLKAAIKGGEKHFIISVHYVPDRVTNGGTKQ